MKISLRNTYFGWLLLLLGLSYAFMTLVLTSIELKESHLNNTPFKEELPEVFAVLIVMAFTLPVVTLAAWHIAGRLLRPLRQMVNTAEHISSGHLDERIPPMPHTDEIARLADTMNEAFDRYAKSVKQMENFSADASHQLRTPLTAIRSTAEITLQLERQPKAYQEALGDILEQTNKLNMMMDQLLFLSQLNESMKDDFQTIDLPYIIQTWIAEVEELFDRVNIVFQYEPSTHGIIRGNATLLQEVFNNLINNAQSFTPPGGTIAITLSQQPDNRIVWRIEDSGPGIPDQDLPRIFDRFYRGKKSHHKGSGLGLAIVRDIISLHLGTIEAGRSQSYGGAAFSMTLPCSAPSTS